MKMIKNIEDLKKCQITCRNQNQVKDCLNYLKQLGFNVDCYDCENYLIVFYDTSFDGFITSYELEKKYVEFYNKELIKTLQKIIKEKQEKEKIKDIEVTEDGRIIKINNYKSEEKVFIACQKEYSEETIWDTINNFKPEFLDFLLKYGLAYATAEARDRAMFKLEIETKLKNIAERLNAGRKIDWGNGRQEKFSIYYDYKNKILSNQDNAILCYSFEYSCKSQGTIYCLDKNFLEVAKQEIGEENLIKYFKE